LDEKVIENHKRYSQRMNFYKDLGYDVLKERNFILEKAYPVYGNILEIGTGKGYFTVQLAKEGFKFTSIDISKDEQKFAKLNIKYFGLEKNVDFRIEDAEHLSFDDSSYDVIFAINTLHHLKNSAEVIDELIRILSFEGKIILSDFNQKGLEIIGKIHSREGKKHEAGTATVLAVGNYLESKSFIVKKYNTEFQDVLIAYYQII
jgi:2-polyprenyl-3-methyl-5-hydroxy-6-metoxy-1,4-benzoquinol methylase